MVIEVMILKIINESEVLVFFYGMHIYVATPYTCSTEKEHNTKKKKKISNNSEI